MVPVDNKSRLEVYLESAASMQAIDHTQKFRINFLDEAIARQPGLGQIQHENGRKGIL